MEAAELHRGRLIDHVHLVVKDLAASRRFYLAVFDVLGIPIGAADPAAGFFWADELFVSSVDGKDAAGRALSATGKPAGGKDNGAPGLRPYHPEYYAAFVLDPDGNNIEVVHHGPGHRSAASVKITF